MGLDCRAGWLAAPVALVAVLLTSAAYAQLGLGLSSRFELSDSVQVDEVDSTAKTHLERIKAFVANGQWDEAVETLRQLSENHGGKVVAITPRRYVSVRDYCHLRLVQLAGVAPEALELYRGRVDPQARRWYEEGVRNRDPRPLLRVVEQLFASSWGDNALYALGDLALEEGDFGHARGYWEKILPPAYWSRHMPPSSQADGTTEWLVYPDSELDLVEVQARIVLVLILEGNMAQAQRGLDVFAQEYGDAQGRLGGREVNYVEFLSALAEESSDWPQSPLGSDWPTFAGAPTRNKLAPGGLEVGGISWRSPLPKTPVADVTYSPRRVAEDRKDLLSYHPLVVGNLVLVNDLASVRAFDLHSGRPAWGDDPVIYRDDTLKTDPQHSHRSSLGAPRFTMTASNGKLYARMGNPVTSRSSEPATRSETGYLVCIDLAAEGRLLWRSEALADSWSFEGSPLADATNIYVALRRSDVRPQAYVACLDAQTGHVRWRQFVCGAETPAQGTYEEITHNLLTLDRGVIYYSTNLGAVAALAADDGQLKWVTLYPRAKSGDLNQRAKHFYRDLTPCIHEDGVLYVAPSDSRHLMALDAPTGLLIWQTDLPEDVVHLLGVAQDHLLASGDRLWWIKAANGKIEPVGSAVGPWPDGPSPRGFGRGVLAGDKVYWPTRSMIHVFDLQTGQQEPPIELTTRGAQGGNLLVADRVLLITTSDEIIAFGPQTAAAPLRDQAAVRGTAGEPSAVENNAE